LHGGVVDDSHGDAKGLLEIEADPTATEIVGFAEGTPVDDRPGIAKRDALEIPAASASF
jgi:hypothetical protein